jgi:hypothetical protein
MIVLVCIHSNEIVYVLVKETVSKSAASITRIFWQVESGKLVLEKAEFDLEAELTALIDVFSVQCDNKGLFISLQLAGQCTLNTPPTMYNEAPGHFFIWAIGTYLSCPCCVVVICR